MAGEKTEKASEKKREDERKHGHIFQSQDIVTALSMLVFFLLLKAMGSTFTRQITGGMRGLLEGMTTDVSGWASMRVQLVRTVAVAMGVLLPVMLVTVGASIIGTMAQTRMLVYPGEMKFQLNRLSPIQGIKRMFSVRSLFELVKSLIKVAAVGAVIYAQIRPQIGHVLLLFDSGLGDSLSWMFSTVMDVGFKASMVMLFIGVGDYFFQWYTFERDIRMSKQEVREEYKQMEGNPETKSRIRGLQRRMARQRMMQAVKTADVVIRNPTHFAVALRYRGRERGAPVVVAKGQDAVALRIVAEAERHHIYVTENIPLARALYRSVEIGQEIPAEYYKAVAEVLAYIYRLRRAGRM